MCLSHASIHDSVDEICPPVTLVPDHTPRLREHCRRRLGLGTIATTGTRGAASAATVGGTSSAVAVAAGGGALTPALELLRPHVFGFLRVAFSPESTMDTSSATFSVAVELWMLWMRPWAAPAILRGECDTRALWCVRLSFAFGRTVCVHPGEVA